MTAAIHDISAPEVRSTAQALSSFIENGGSAAAPFLAGLIAVRSSLHMAIIVMCVSIWLVCAALFGVVAYLVPHDIDALHQTMRERAERERIAGRRRIANRDS